MFACKPKVMFISCHYWMTQRCYGFCQNGREPDELLPDLILATVSVIEMTNLATVPTNRNAFWQPSPKFRFFWHFWQPSQTTEIHSGKCLQSLNLFWKFWQLSHTIKIFKTKLLNCMHNFTSGLHPPITNTNIILLRETFIPSSISMT